MLVVALNQENYPDTDSRKTAHLTTGNPHKLLFAFLNFICISKCYMTFIRFCSIIVRNIYLYKG